jgi:arylsulfatase A-like enzyme
MKIISPSVIKSVALLGIASFACGTKHGNTNKKEKLNVLFIAIDDLRPHLGCYGFENVKSPNIDRIAANGLIFKRAYCQFALSSPSRTSLFTGLNPDVTGVKNNGPKFRDTIPDLVALPQHFKNNGYFALGFGKLYHNGLDDPESWTVPHVSGSRPRYAPAGAEINKRVKAEYIKRSDYIPGSKILANGPPFESFDCADNYFLDGGNTESALKALERLKDTTFFLAVGFANVHIPYVSPKRYWDMYDPDQINLPSNQYPPDGAPEWALQSLHELYTYYNIPSPLTEEFKRELIRGYLAATSYVDAQIGHLVEALKEYNLLDKTVIVIFGDHGYQLGEHYMWSSKHTNYETSTLAPLIIRVPGMKAKGGSTSSLVEFIDIYPSLADICGLQIPPHCQGRSFKALLDDPAGTIKLETYSQYNKGGYRGYTIRDDQYRLVQWIKGKEIVYELYNHITDPEENKNIAGDPAMKRIIENLDAKINIRKQNDISLNRELIKN